MVDNRAMHTSNSREEPEVITTVNKRTRAATRNSTVSQVEETGNVESVERTNDYVGASDTLGEPTGESTEVPGGTGNLPFGSPRNTPDIGLGQELVDLEGGTVEAMLERLLDSNRTDMTLDETSGLPSNTTDVGLGQELVDLDGEPDEAMLEKLSESNHIPGNLNEASGMSSGVMRNTDPMEDECNVIDFDTPGQSHLPPESDRPFASLQDHSSQFSEEVRSFEDVGSFEGVGSFEAVGPSTQTRPGLDLRQLILDWRWVFGPHLKPKEPRQAATRPT